MARRRGVITAWLRSTLRTPASRAPEMRVMRRTLERYVRSPWLAVDLVLLLAVFAFSFRSSFDARYFFTTAFFLLGILSVVGGVGLIHGVMPSEAYLPLAREYGARRCLMGLALAVVCIRAITCLLLLLLALLFHRFTVAAGGDLAAGMLGLLPSCALLGVLPLVLSSPPASPDRHIVALTMLVLGLASYNVTGTPATFLLITRLPLLPFIACYALCQGNASVWMWLSAPVLALAALVGLILLTASWLTPFVAAQTPARPAGPQKSR